MKSVLISIKPKHCGLIASGEQTLIVTKIRPKLEMPFKCYIYETRDGGRGRGKVIGEFVCDLINEFHDYQLSPSGRYKDYEENELQTFLKTACLSYQEVCEYRANLPYYKPFYYWYISELKIYDEPKALSEFRRYCDTCSFPFLPFGAAPCGKCLWVKITRAPQSWCYVEEVGA